MSNPSGISTSLELQKTFRDFLGGEQRALILEIENEQCVAGTVIEGGDEFEEDFSKVASHLEEDQARYVVVRENKQSLIFISFVPDKAPVRSKMLYASSTNTVHRELGGTQTFKHNVFWTELSEVSAKGWNAHVKHIEASAPRTEEEESLQDVIEKEADQLMGSRKSPLHQMHHTQSKSGLALVMDEEVHDALEALKELEQGALSMHIDMPSEKVVVGQQSSTTNEQSLQDFISTSTPQYTVYKHDHSTAVFIYTCPSGSKVKERMMYASNRESVVSATTKRIAIKKVVEATDRSEVSTLTLLDYLKPEDESASSSRASPAPAKFSRPKRPGR